MNPFLQFCHTDTPSPSPLWLGSDARQRLDLIQKAMTLGFGKFSENLQIAHTHPDGQVIVRLINKLSPLDRSTMLLDFEEHLKKNLDQGLTVWLESLGDKNSLRNLRGIEVKQHG